MKKLKIAVLSMFALGATALTGFSQGVPPSGTFTATQLTIPQVTLAAGGSTNLANGWQTILSYTNTSGPFYSNGVSTLVTNIYTVTNTAYANMSIISQKDLGVVISESAGIGTNTYFFGRGIDSSSVDTNNTVSLTIGHVAAGTATGSISWPTNWLSGYGVVQLTSYSWTAASAGWTNNYIKFGKIVSVK